MNNINKILVLAPHTDDGEFGCGGSVARFIEEGKEIYYAVFSTAEESVPDPWPSCGIQHSVKGLALWHVKLLCRLSTGKFLGNG